MGFYKYKRLSSLQNDLVRMWFQHTSEYFVTGGTALVGYYDVPRTTDDVDLFTTSRVCFDEAPGLVSRVCESLGAEANTLRTAPDCHRYRIRRRDEETLLDVVYDMAPQLHAVKSKMPDGVLADAPDEILVNKLCALVGRSEPRDYYDVFILSQSGLDPDVALTQATVKDAGVDRESMAFVLAGLNWETFTIPGVDVDTVARVATFFRAWSEKLVVELFPHVRGGPAHTHEDEAPRA